MRRMTSCQMANGKKLAGQNIQKYVDMKVNHWEFFLVIKWKRILELKWEFLLALRCINLFLQRRLK